MEFFLKFKHRLFGSKLNWNNLFIDINFVGELNRRGLLSETIIFSVFDLLLSVDEQES